MVTMPVITQLKIKNYGLFPGTPQSQGVNQTFDAGLTLVAGINGLGKTTILSAILRALTGPYDLASHGRSGEVSVSIPEKPVKLNSKALSYFRQRVADGAKEAIVHLTAIFNRKEITIVRKLSNLSLIKFEIDGEPSADGPNIEVRETKFQYALAELMELGSFVDVLLILHHVVLFEEDRPGVLWNQNAQRQILRALFLDKTDARRVADLERLVQSADSQARNIHARMTATEGELRRARLAESGAEATVAKLEAEQKLLDADLAEKSRLTELLAELTEERQVVRLELEKAKISREETAGAVERLKYSALANLYPNMEEASKLIIARILTQGKCLVCDAEAENKRQELESLLEKGVCPACGTPSDEQHNVTGKYKFEQAKIGVAREKARLASVEESSKSARLIETVNSFNETLSKLTELQQSIENRRQREKQLKVQLPGSMTGTEIENTLTTLRRQYNEWMTRLETHIHELATLLSEKEGVIKAQASAVTNYFSELTRLLLAEDAKLAEAQFSPRYTQALRSGGSERLKFPAYQAEMVAANRPGFVRRFDTSDVSESQRELIDLAFRLTLLRVASPDTAATFIMETPEASLDGMAIKRVGTALSEFAKKSENRLLVTSNLSNAGLITYLFGGPSKSKQETKERRRRLLNLLDIATPNQALEQDREAYERLLDEAVVGDDK